MTSYGLTIKTVLPGYCDLRVMASHRNESRAWECAWSQGEVGHIMCV